MTKETNIIEEILKRFDEEFLHKIKTNVYGFCCGKCGGGGVLGQDTCDDCDGYGIIDWRTNLLEEDIKQFLLQSIKEVLEEITEEDVKSTNMEESYMALCRNILNLISQIDKELTKE